MSKIYNAIDSLIIIISNQMNNFPMTICRKFNNVKDNYCLGKCHDKFPYLHSSNYWYFIPLCRRFDPSQTVNALITGTQEWESPARKAVKDNQLRHWEDADWRPQTVNENAKDG